ncbi:phage minor head protein [Zunongwangia profunda]|uniref:phage head morphogenesis protein n=1 Tax=Zunongwangia profunda TaxID=398743 RepID=UPI00248DE374|nr:phage minor head protein [Zunongwangia profunda]
MHYRSKCSHTPTIQLAKQDQHFSGLIEEYVRELFDERQLSEGTRNKLWQYYYDELSDGVDIGYSPELEQYDPELAARLKYNIAEFSAFKETSFKKQLEGLLTKNGKIQPWSTFKKEALKVSGDYNVRWLKTEYHQTVATANMAGKWKDFEANKDLYPNLKYVTAGDNRVREEHRQWDGLVLPINHPWWATHFPPQDWGCRCGAVQTDEEVSTDIPGGEAKKGFANNAGLSGEVFTDIAYKDGLSDTEIDQATATANRLFKRDTRLKDFKTYKDDPGFTDVKFNEENSGLKATHKLHNFDKRTGKYEKHVRDLFFNQGDKIELAKELAAKGEKVIEGVKKVDGYLNNASIDISSILGEGKNTISRALKHSAEKPADVAILYFPDASKFSMSRLITGIKKYEGRHDFRFQKIIYIVDDKIREIKP